MAKLVMLPLAVADLEKVVDYLSQFYPSTALRQYEHLVEQMRRLVDFPESCPLYDQSFHHLAYRRLVVDDYLVFYVVVNGDVQIHRIQHGSRDVRNYLR